MTDTLFGFTADQKKKRKAPLADRMRPERLEDVFGQDTLTKDGAMLTAIIARGHIPSMVFWGPPGTGKTTLARIVARMTEARFVQLSGVTSGVTELRQCIHEARERLELHGTHTVVFVDEIHRWNTAQQDACLPHVEDGTITLIGATTENPSFALNSALLSRAKVLVLNPLETEDIAHVVRRALTDTVRGMGSYGVTMDDDAVKEIAGMADGDARSALSILEMIVLAQPASGSATASNMIHLTAEDIRRIVSRTSLQYDKSGEAHFNAISALHKSVRGNDPNAAVYWLARMLEAGEPPLYVARRLIRMASEDIGIADPMALVITNAAHDAVLKLGMPECTVCLAEAVIYLAKAPKSIAAYTAYKAAAHEVRNGKNDPVPLHLRNAPTALMKDMGYGKDYIYTPHAQPNETQEYLPKRLIGKPFFIE